MKTHPHEPKDGMTVEKVSLAVLAVFGVFGLAYFIATALEVLPIIRRPERCSPRTESSNGYV
jgi:hypothetical protein